MRTSVNWVLLLLAYAGLFVGGVLDNARGPLLPEMIDSLQISDRQASLFFSVGFMTSIGGSLMMGHCMRYWRAAVAIRYSMAIIAAGFLCIAVGQHFVVILCGSALYGIGMGAMHVVNNLAVAQATPAATRTRHYNFLHVMYSVASLLAPLLVIVLRGVFHRWQMSFLVLALLPLLLCVYSLTDTSPAALPPDGGHVPLLRVLADGTCRYYAGLLGVYVAAELCVAIWLVLYVTRLELFSANVNAASLTCFFIAMASSRFFGGILLKDHHHRRVLLVASGVAIACIAGGLYLHPLLLAVSGAPLGIFFPTCFASMSHELHGKMEAATGWVMSVVFIAVSMGQSVMGWLSDVYSLRMAMHLPIVLLCGVIVMLLARKFPSVCHPEHSEGSLRTRSFGRFASSG